ncbi:class II glutamine amidotransferase [Plantactinospora sp. CA-290183]|uniref:class II glutamine amidotransferase n=1 Tax=Plantactinospora sp. CA-290183 TaxID=3240006 RepID=UPI003D937890
MCLLTFFPAGVLPETSALINGTYTNGDGHGFAIVAENQILVRHGMDGEAMVDAFAAARQEHPDGPALFHSRITTAGRTNVDNCHPFQVGGDRRTVLAHNGVLPHNVQPAMGDSRSDTRITAEDFLPRQIGSLHLRRNRLLFERWMTPHNKMVILTVNRRFKKRAYILNEDSGIWDGGIWYSNDSYLPLDPRWANSRWDWPLWGRAVADLDRCMQCNALVDLDDGACWYCGWCFDCGELPQDCFCYTPAALDSRLSGDSWGR